MNVKKIIALTILLFTMIGCTSQPETMEETPKVDMTKINNSSSITQEVSNQAKDRLREHKDVSNIHAVNTEKKLAITIEIPHMKRFRLQEVEKQLTKEMEKEFPKMDVNLSTDQKIILELEQLESDIKDKSLTKKEVNKKVKKIIDLMNEET